MTTPALLEAIRALIVEVVREELARSQPSVEYLSPEQAGAVAGVTAATVRRWIRAGRLTALRAGSRVRVLRSDLDRMLRIGTRRGDLADDTPLTLAARAMRRAG